MKWLKKIQLFNIKLLLFLLGLFPVLSKGTHIVGGELNYIYNGGSSYTIILRLYRDCGPNTAAFPTNVSIVVRGNNGATFSPSKDFNMALASVSNVPSSQPPCAVAPNPVPCVQVGTYSIVVNNLPPNIGGYHLYYQVTARNLSLTNINGSCNCIGESFYAYIPNNSVSANNNNNAVFTNLPPLFLCVNTPFSFNHSATDANGDSLVYSLYNPYNGDNGPGPLDPTFPANTASFTPVTYLPGFTANNPLGASPFSINPQTGILTGTPGMIGQFVVGVKVTEYRNGNYISQTLRDFQFNVINCPQPPPTLAIANFTINNGCVKTVTAGGITQSSASWTSIFPGSAGTYNNYLACTSGCLNNTVTATGTPPPFVDYKVCGTSTNCAATNVCDTFRVYFNPTLSVNIVPTNPSICFSQASTTLMAIGSGGTPNYNYLWNNSNPSQIITVGNGTYNVALSDASGCPPVFKSVVVTTYSTPIVANAGPNVYRCVQSPIATINASVTGASGGIWSGGTGTFSPNNITLNNLNYIPSAAEIATGSVSLILTTTGNGACPANSDTMTIFFKNFTGAFNFSVNPVSCFGGSNGSATVNITGGDAPHQYTWTSVPVQTTSIANNLTVGYYSVTVTNSIGCVSSSTVQITQPLPITLNSTLTSVFCYSSSNASIITSAIGGNGGYTYSWSPTASSASSLVNVAAGNYTVKVTDSKNCQFTSTFAITQPSSLTIATSNTNVSCFNGSNGAFSNTVNGGTAPYTYTWMPNMASTQNLQNLSAGNYTYVVKDSKGCSLTKTLVITQPNQITSTLNIVNGSCNNSNNGSATISVSGGTPTFSFQIMPGNFTTSIANNLAAGNYSVQITDNNACVQTTNFSITQPPTLVAAVMNQVNVACFGGNTGKLTANPSGGTPVYSYLWLPGSFTTASINNLNAGTYTLFVTDAKSCTSSVTAIITQPTALNVVASFTNLLCNSSSNGAISLNASGGVAPYTSTLMPGNIVNSNFSNLPAGNYTVYTNDANACAASNTVTINQPANFSSVTSFTNSSCNMSNGSASVSITSGGVPPFTYTWLPSGGNSALASNLTAGAYTVYVTDNNGCTSNHMINVNDVLGPVVSIASTTNVSCFGFSNGAAAATFTGGTGPLFTYSWSPAGGNALIATNLPSGIYVIKITDSNGCVGLATTSLISQPTQLMTLTAKTNVTCFNAANGSANVVASGGTPAYSYSWFPGSYTTSNVSSLSSGVYTVFVTDNNNCISSSTLQITQPASLIITPSSVYNVPCFSGNNGSITVNVSGGTPNYNYNWNPAVGNGPTITNLSPGNYVLNVTDNNNCPAITTIVITQPAASLTALANTQSVSCFGSANGSATIQVNGGTAGYTYTWSPGVSTTSLASALNVGNYNVQVKDTKGCQVQLSFQINQPSALNSSLTFTNPSCGNNNGGVQTQISGGVGPYVYSWSPTISNAASIYSLSSGSYSVNISDSHNCNITKSVSLINIPGPNTAVSSSTNVSCFSYNNGAAAVTISSGTGPFSIQWLPFGGNSTTASSLIAGTYSVKVTDQNNCVSSSTVTITEPSVLSLTSITASHLTCYQSNDGSVSANVTGGTPGYIYTWLPAGNTSSLNNLPAGNYTVSISDAKGCKVNGAVILSEPALLSSTITNILNAPCYNSGGSATVLAIGGTLPYTYNWVNDPTQNGNVISNVTAANYTVIINDAHNCSSTNTFVITEPTLVQTTSVPSTTICVGQNATLTPNATGGTGNYSYLWMPLNITTNGDMVVSPFVNSSYTVMAFDKNGCSGSSAKSNVTVFDFSNSNVSVSGISPVCPGQISLLQANVNGNTGAVKYYWSGNAGTVIGSTAGPIIVSPSVQTTYTVTVSNQCGIRIHDTITVKVISQPTISFVSDSIQSCLPAVIHFTDNSVSGYSLDPITSWSWNMGDGQYSTDRDPIYTYTASGIYSVTLKASTDNGCTNENKSAPWIITVFPQPLAAFKVNSCVLDLPFDHLVCTNTSQGAIKYNWDFGDGNTSLEIHPEHVYSSISENTVQLIVINDHGCSDTTQKIITTKADVVFPNAFTPDPTGSADGHYDMFSLNNDVFHPYASGVEEYKLQVFNRWGEMIFESTDFYYGWNGKYRGEICEMGVYIWKAYVKLNNGRVYKKTGDVTLIK